MARFDSSIDLPARPSVCWSFVVERGHEIEPLVFVPEEPQAVGVINHLRHRNRLVPIRASSRTVTWDPPSVCAFESTMTWPVHVTIKETFAPHEAGTRHTISYVVSGGAVAGRVLAPILCHVMRGNRRVYQERLRDALTASS